MGTCALPNLYAFSPWACGPQAFGMHMHIDQSTQSAHVITIAYTSYNEYNHTYAQKIIIIEAM